MVLALPMMSKMTKTTERYQEEDEMETYGGTGVYHAGGYDVHWSSYPPMVRYGRRERRGLAGGVGGRGLVG